MISADADVDYYYFYVSTLSDVTIHYRNNGYDAGRLRLYRSWAGALLSSYGSGSFSDPWQSSGDHVYQLPAGLYYAEAYAGGFGAGDDYDFGVSGPSVSTRPPSLSDTHRGATLLTERFETSHANAFIVGPYAIYKGATSAAADVDWYRFYVTWKSDVRLGYDSPGWDATRVSLYKGSPANWLWEWRETTQYAAQLNPGVYYIKVTGGEGSTYWFSVHGARVSKHPYAKLGKPIAKTRVKRRQRFSLSGTILVKHATGSKGTLLKCYRRQSGKWVLRKTVVAPHVNPTSGGTKYAATLSLPYSGMWRIRAYHRDVSHLGTYSGYVNITVK